VCGWLGLFACGCRSSEIQSGTIEVDLSAAQVRFIIDDRYGWQGLFRRPKVTNLAIASQEDELLWELRAVAAAGEPTDRLAFVYGQVPPDFEQVFPKGGASPKPLVAGRSYFVGVTGPREAYRVAFALPVHALDWQQDRLRAGEPPSSPPTTGPTSQPIDR
jgi:hypothetical protein